MASQSEGKRSSFFSVLDPLFRIGVIFSQLVAFASLPRRSGSSLWEGLNRGVTFFRQTRRVSHDAVCPPEVPSGSGPGDLLARRSSSDPSLSRSALRPCPPSLPSACLSLPVFSITRPEMHVSDLSQELAFTSSDFFPMIFCHIDFQSLSFPVFCFRGATSLQPLGQAALLRGALGLRVLRGAGVCLPTATRAPTFSHAACIPVCLVISALPTSYLEFRHLSFQGM